MSSVNKYFTYTLYWFILEIDHIFIYIGTKEPTNLCRGRNIELLQNVQNRNHCIPPAYYINKILNVYLKMQRNYSKECVIHNYVILTTYLRWDSKLHHYKLNNNV